ncbi:Lin1244/Lin1753 domain-containing protein [Megasphaera cerevisiae]|uniref:Lin1244/Lin1753 domain-containing protein n=1 Tax=Megasphaera cerevisiae TaxID=39029 RepID=UPI00069DD2AD|nr:Lin1244/Lin1753 domain-containing protein [Megasphaera cerevisiae]SJZ60722.1 DnaD and phage-associated domain-containing protein [Megasphaera cerevisiae DSM 20462]
MARPIKQGLDYFPLDVGFLQDVKIRRIMRACGIQSIPVLISLLANIYRNDGYFLRWGNDMPFLIADELGVSEGAVTATVDKAVQVDFFNANMFQKHSVLTSEGIQHRFFDAVTRRSAVRYDARFLLINVSAYNNLINACNNSINEDDNTQSKVKESKVEESSSSTKKTAADFGKLVKSYQNNVHPIANDIEKDKLLDLLKTYGLDACLKAIERAVLRGLMNIGYIGGILRRWQENGYDDPSGFDPDNGNHMEISQYDKIDF